MASQQLARAEYEKYGNLMDSNIQRSLTSHSAASHYGRVEVRFHKDRVLATWTAVDSLGEKYQPSLCSDPKSCSFDNLSKTPATRVKTDNFVTFKKNHISRYLELQYLGDLTPDCVKSISFPYDITEAGNIQALDIAKKWKKFGVDVFYIQNGNLKNL